MTSQPRIVLLHATSISMAPIHLAFARGWPEAEIVNLLDDGLTIDRTRTEELTDAMVSRFIDLGRYSVRNGADAILATCSAFGPALDAMAADLPIPVLKPNEAMFRAALALGTRIGMVATFAPAVSSMSEEFARLAAETGVAATLETVVVAEASARLRDGDVSTHNRLVADRVGEMKGYDVVMLAHFSTSRAEALAIEATDTPVLTAPGAAVERIRELLGGFALSPREA